MISHNNNVSRTRFPVSARGRRHDDVHTSSNVNTGFDPFGRVNTPILVHKVSQTLTRPSIWICLTGESNVPVVEAITAVDTGEDSLREAIWKLLQAATRGKRGDSFL